MITDMDIAGTRKAPDFELQDQNGETHRLADYAGDWLVLYFYPKDGSLNCTKEACLFRDEQQVLRQFGNAKIIGINKGSVASHKDFADKNHLNFPILSDPTTEVTKAYGAWRTAGARLVDRPYATRRNTYLINPAGEIVKQYVGVIPRNHVETIIRDLQELQTNS